MELTKQKQDKFSILSHEIEKYPRIYLFIKVY